MAEIISPKNVNKFIVWLFMPWKGLKAFSESGTTLGTPGICDSPGNPWNYSGLPWEPFESGTPLGTHGIRDSLGNPWNWVLSWLPLEFVTPLGIPGIRDSSGHPWNSGLPWENPGMSGNIRLTLQSANSVPWTKSFIHNTGWLGCFDETLCLYIQLYVRHDMAGKSKLKIWIENFKKKPVCLCIQLDKTSYTRSICS